VTAETAGATVPGSRVATRRAATRERILTAAWGLARESGLGGFSLRELAAQVGMRAPSLYEYFDGKDAIYDAMFAQGNRQLLAAMDELPDVDRVGRRVALIAAARGFLTFAVGDPVRFQLLFQRAIAGWEPSPEAYAPAVEVLERTERFLAECGAADRRSLDLWTALVSGMAHQQVANDPTGDRWDRLVEDVVDLMLHHLDGR
jgi:AcrR family transcriptional regulator